MPQWASSACRTFVGGCATHGARASSTPHQFHGLRYVDLRRKFGEDQSKCSGEVGIQQYPYTYTHIDDLWYYVQYTGGSHACPSGSGGGFTAPHNEEASLPPKDGFRPSYDGAASVPQRVGCAPFQLLSERLRPPQGGSGFAAPIKFRALGRMTFTANLVKIGQRV